MSFSNFLSQLLSGFSDILENFAIYVTMLLENNWIKLIIYTSLASVVFWLLFQIYDLFLEIFDSKNKNSKQKNPRIE